MKWIRLRSSDEKYFNQAWAIYEQSFPVFEQRLLRDQQAAMKDEEFYFIAIVEEERVIAIVGYWIYPHFIYIEHLAVHPEVRGQKIGTKVLHELRELQKTLILEIDPPVDNISIKRLHFYENVGFKLNDYPHVHPAYRLEYKGHELKVLSYPQGISLHVFKIFRQYLNDTVMKYSER